MAYGELLGHMVLPRSLFSVVRMHEEELKIYSMLR